MVSWATVAFKSAASFVDCQTAIGLKPPRVSFNVSEVLVIASVDLLKTFSTLSLVIAVFGVVSAAPESNASTFFRESFFMVVVIDIIERVGSFVSTSSVS